MNFGNIIKGVQFSLLRGAGVAVTPDQIGLKLPGSSTTPTSGFAAFLSKSMGQKNGLTIPTPPTAPEIIEGTDAATALELQSKYNQDLLAYNQQFQTYHTQMLQYMMGQMIQAQRLQQMRANSSPASSSTVGSTPIATGGILDGEL